MMATPRLALKNKRGFRGRRRSVSHCDKFRLEPLIGEREGALLKRKERRKMKAEFYNTISLSGDDLTEARESNKHQNDVILEIFRTCNEALTPFEVQDCLFAKKIYRWPITSIRRAITDLQKLGKLIKTSQMRSGRYGKPNYCWQIQSAA